jgi:hypothetical protein
MFAAIAITGVVCFFGGVFVGRKYEQRIVAKALAKFAQLDRDAKAAIERVYHHIGDGIKSELRKLLP